MDNPHGSFQGLMHDVAAGDQVAARTFVERYEDDVFRAVRSVMGTTIRSKFDADDFVQMVWCAVFSEPARLGELNSAEELTAFLCKTARNIVISVVRQHLMTAKRGAQHTDESTHRRRERSRVEDLPGGTPEPVEEMIARETLQRLRFGQPPESCLIIELRIEGYTEEEIAGMTDTTRSAVYRILKDLFQKLDRPAE
jgi:RNA polymerase sigma factor (sigma-70 family)